MLVYRIAREKYIKDLSGTGAKMYGGRWNKSGSAMLYTGSSLALAGLEQLARNSVEILNTFFAYIILEIPETYCPIIKSVDLDSNWNQQKPSQQTKEIGGQFIQNGENLIMGVPSTMIDHSINYVINTNHALFNSIKIIEIGNLNINTRLN